VRHYPYVSRLEQFPAADLGARILPSKQIVCEARLLCAESVLLRARSLLMAGHDNFAPETGRSAFTLNRWKVAVLWWRCLERARRTFASWSKLRQARILFEPTCRTPIGPRSAAPVEGGCNAIIERLSHRFPLLQSFI